MTGFNKETSLFCIFHNQDTYLIDGKPCSHIYSGIVQQDRGQLELLVQDFDGSKRSIDTDPLTKKFNLAVMVPIARQSANAIQTMVGKLNLLDKKGKWPFYFSPDMSLVCKHEISGQLARAPEGHIDPPSQQQKTHLYTGTGVRLLKRVNCVRMALMVAQMAGVKVSNIAGVNPLSHTGEDVRDAIRAAHQRLLSGGQRQETYLFADSFVARQKGNDKNGANFVLGTDGLCIIQSDKKEFRMSGFCDALSRPIQGKSLFNWVSEGRRDRFKQSPVAMPAYLKEALSLL